jgi:septal ring factor EnvC (AmiA/AmiB activator)
MPFMPRRAGLLLLLTLLLLVPPPAPAAAGGDETRQQELARIRREIGELEARLARVRERAEGVAGRLQTLEVELALQEQRLAEAQAAGELAAGEAAASEAEVERLSADLTAARADLSRRLGGLYRLGSQGYLRMVLSLESRGQDLLAGLRMLRYLARRDARAVDRFTAARDELEAQRELLVARRAEVDRWVAEEEARRGELAAARRRQAAMLARIEGERERLAQRAGELADRERKMSRFLDLVAGESGADPAGTPIQELKGVLEPPVAGRVTAGFGPRLDPRYRTRVPHNGLSYATTPGAPVAAVYAGKVLYAAPFQGYGPTVVVHHPGRVFTLYAGLGALAVEVGQEVALGQPLGRADDDLYFEVRVEKRAEDPAGWLR